MSKPKGEGLTATRVARAKPNPETSYGIADHEVRGLRLSIRPHGTKTYTFRYQRDNRDRNITLGHVGDLTLEEARDRAREARKLLRSRIDPFEQRKNLEQQAREQALRESSEKATFGEIAELWLAAKRHDWSPTYYKQVTSKLNGYLLHKLADEPIINVDSIALFKVLRDRYEEGRKESARNARRYAGNIIDFAKSLGKLPKSSANAAQELIGDKALKKTTATHRAALPQEKVGAFLYALDMARVSQRISPQVFAATLTAMLTGSREGAVRAMQWRDIDLKAGIWVCQPGAMKSRRPFTTFLPKLAINAIKKLSRGKDDDFVFASPYDRKRMLSSNTLRLTLHRLGFPFTAHGFRSLLVDWAHEQGQWSNEVIAKLIDHTLPGVQAAYLRTGFNLKRRELLDAWGKYCEDELSETARN